MQHYSLLCWFQKCTIFNYVDSWPKILLFTTHNLWNSTTELTLNHIYYRYRADENGYVADVRYEGLVQPFVPPPPPPVEAAPAPLVKRNSPRKGNPVGKVDGRPIVKRNENTSTDDFEFSTDIKNVKEVTPNKRQHKNQQQKQQHHQKQQKQKQPEYYQPQAYHPF